MYRQPIIDFLQSNQPFPITKILKQRWKQTRYSYRTTPRPDHGLMLLVQGELKLITRTETLVIRAGDLVFLPKNAHYEAVFESDAEDYLVNFDGETIVPEIPAPVLLLRGAPLSCSEGFALLVEEHLHAGVASLKCRGLFYLLLDSIVSSAFAEASGKRERIEKAKTLLRSEEELRISEIAAKCGISESGFRKEFKAAVGLSPTEYRLQFKLTKAMYLLESTDLTVSEIADTLHFYDAAYFCRLFRSYTGMSPMQFAKRKQL